VNILDENIPEDQYQLLRRRRISIRQIGRDVGRKGMIDEEIIPYLRSLRRPTFFTRDFDFYRRDLCHERYSLVCLGIRLTEVADYVDRLLRHREFNTQAKRMGAVIGVTPTGISVWRRRAARLARLPWDD
jgi:hypothetical protein